uniref:Nucleolar complex protein 2 homolog n=1 Tax=Parastrongyloides trichosuri TaxID=131310 RepID=A0A0N4ZZ60_PARTI
MAGKNIKFKKAKQAKQLKKKGLKKVKKNNSIYDVDDDHCSEGSVELDELFNDPNNDSELEEPSRHNFDDDELCEKESNDSEKDEEDELDIHTHMEELKKISEADPSFLKFLQEQDPDLLNFKDDEEVFDEEEQDEFIESFVITYGTKKYNVKYNEEQKKIVDSHVVDYLKYHLLETEASKENLVKAMRILISSFDAATLMIGHKNKKDIKWVIKDTNIFKTILSLCFCNVVQLFYKILQPISEGKETETQLKQLKRSPSNGVTYFKKWKQYGSLCKKYIEAVGVLINGITEDGSKKRVLRHILDLVDLHVHFSTLTKRMVKILTRMWCTAKEGNRILSFTILFKMCRLDRSLYPTILKSCYMTFVTFSGYTCSQNLKSFRFMQRSFAELVLLDASVSYPYVFIYLQQSAVFLRNGIKSKASDNMKNVTKWQFVQGLYLWNEVIIAACKMASTVPDSHPVCAISEQAFVFVQIVIGIYTHTQNQRLLLLRIHCLRILLRLQASTDLYIPILGLSLDALKDLMLLDERKPVKKENIVSEDVIDVNLRINNDMINCLEFRKIIGTEFLKILDQIFDSMKKCVAFDSCVAPIIKRMRYIIKNCKNKEHLAMLKNFVNKLEKESERVSNVVAVNKINVERLDYFEKLLE